MCRCRNKMDNGGVQARKDVIMKHAEKIVLIRNEPERREGNRKQEGKKKEKNSQKLKMYE